MTTNADHVSQLAAMGFSLDQAREALQVTSGDLELAVNHLLSDDGAVNETEYPSSTAALSGSMNTRAGEVIRASFSQYTLSQGRSACTCIALTAAMKFLKDSDITKEFLENTIKQGVKSYAELAETSNAEHMSAEEILQSPKGKSLFPILSIAGGVRQGVLSRDRSHPLGLQSLLESLRREQPSTEWLVVLMTKTPETVLLCISPDSVSPSAYWLIDSHPRPQTNISTAYAKIHPDLKSLCASIEAIFPCTDLGDDIPEMMAMMYNSFDLYPLK